VHRRSSRARRYRHGGEARPDPRAKLEADIARTEEAGDSELADALREVGYAGKWLDRPTGSELLSAEIRRAAGRSS
jgi:hypothetical protein